MKWLWTIKVVPQLIAWMVVNIMPYPLINIKYVMAEIVEILANPNVLSN